jgi:hypothetical protein
MASAGSRTVTAGSELHRPRSTLNNANQYATTGIPATSRASGAEANQDGAVVDDRHDDPAEHRAEYPAAATEQFV